MEKRIGTAPTLVYPESDGEPMAETPRHQQVMIDCMDILRSHFRRFADVYIAGNMLLYYEEGNPRKSISPDVFMVRGLSKKELRTYKTWEQPPTLDFVLEVASPSTYAKDFNEKKAIYEQILRVKEYCIYDPYHEIDPAFVGFRLVGDAYEEIAFVEGRLPCETLGLELGERDGALRLYDPGTAEWLYPSREHVDEMASRVEQEALARQEAESRAEHAEAELEKLRAALERLQSSE
ncbi:Uma2 family endonuclease [Candidatus Poribacteria bacterium]|nr:Uma2 family endonuclease [Candidatus Poribacteria bacterium]